MGPNSTLGVQTLLDAMVAGAQGLGRALLDQASNFALPELKKIAIQIVAIGEHIMDFTEEGARALLDMQIRASIGVLVAMTTMVLIDVQRAINEIIGAIRQTVNGALGFALIG